MEQVVCITGATSGIGRATAGRFLKEGWQVVAVGRRAEKLAELEQAHPGKVKGIALDVRDKERVKRELAGLKAPFAPVDVLVNNAGLALGLEPAQEASLEDWETMIDVNLKGLLYCTEALLPGMAKRGSGHVVNLGSIAGSYAYPGGNVYGATKAFVEQFSRNLRCDLHGTGVRVTNVEPGLLETEFSLVRFKHDAAAAAAVYKGTDPLVADDIADIIYWACSRPARVDICRVEVMPTCQSCGATRVYRKGE